MINFRGIFRGFRRSEARRELATKAIQLEKLVTEKPVDATITVETPLVEQSAIAEVIEEPKVEPILYGEELIRHLNYPNWFYDSQRLLEAWKIKGEAQVGGARISSPDQIRKIYSRLESLFNHETKLFIRYVPWVFVYKNSYLDSYLKKLRDVQTALYAKYGYNTPTEFDWRKSSYSFKDVEALSKLEARLSSLDANGSESEELLKLKEILEASGYDFELVSAIVEKGFRIHTAGKFVGENYLPFRHIRTNTWRAVKDEGEMVLFERTFSRLLAESVILEPTKKSHNRVYSINPHIEQITNPALRAYMSYVFAKK